MAIVDIGEVVPSEEHRSPWLLPVGPCVTSYEAEYLISDGRSGQPEPQDEAALVQLFERHAEQIATIIDGDLRAALGGNALTTASIEVRRGSVILTISATVLIIAGSYAAKEALSKFGSMVLHNAVSHASLRIADLAKDAELSLARGLRLKLLKIHRRSRTTASIDARKALRWGAVVSDISTYETDLAA